LAKHRLAQRLHKWVGWSDYKEKDNVDEILEDMSDNESMLQGDSSWEMNGRDVELVMAVLSICTERSLIIRTLEKGGKYHYKLHIGSECSFRYDIQGKQWRGHLHSFLSFLVGC
jgi:hypothetical protein